MKVSPISVLHKAYAPLPKEGELFRYNCGTLAEIIVVPGGRPVRGAFAIGHSQDGHVTWIPGLDWALEKKSVEHFGFDRVCLVAVLDERTKYSVLPRRNILKPGTVFRYAPPPELKVSRDIDERFIWFVSGGPYWSTRQILGQNPEVSNPGEGDLRRRCEVLWEPESGWTGAAAGEIADFENQHKRKAVNGHAPTVTPEGKRLPIRLPSQPKYDGLTLQECLVRYDVLMKQQERGLRKPDTVLTDLQKDVVSKELSRQVREGLRERRLAEKNRIPCQGDYFDD